MNSDSRPTLRVLYEDNHLLVVDKPPLLPTMGVAEGEDSLLVRAKEYIRTKFDKPGNVYLGVVSRLDAFTSGVVVLARTSKAAARLTKQFQSGTVVKRYLALVAAEAPESASWLDHLAKNDAAHRMEVVESTRPGAKEARLEFNTLTCDQRKRLVDIRLFTGRKHQIRVQFSSRGWPILGDQKYGSEMKFGPGIALCSSSVEFEHPTRKIRMKFETTPPNHWPFDRVIRHHLKNLSSPGHPEKM